MRDAVAVKTMSAQEALAPLRSGRRVVVGSGAAEPQKLVEALCARAERLSDVEVLHLLTLGPAPYADARFAGRLRHNALFIGPNVRGAVKGGLADYTPCFLSEIPAMMRSGRLPVDVALIQVSEPKRGYCSLGISVDILKAAVENASYVVAQINGRMPATGGDSLVSVDDIDAFVRADEELPELPPSPLTPEAKQIGRYVARLVENGATIQLGIGAIPNAVLAALASKKDLGVHSEMISDGILPLIAAGVVNGRRKTLHPGKIVVGFCLGTRKLYDAVGSGSLFEFRPVDYVNDPFVIARNDKMTSVNSALQVDLTGQVAADSLGTSFYSGVGGQVDFIRGATRAPGGRSIIALPATARGGALSRISAVLPPGTGIVTSRADVDFIVTEFGIASLKGKTIRERATALMQIAHPKFRAELAEQAKAAGYLDRAQPVLLDPEPYPAELETRRRFGKTDVFFRPIKPTDLRRLKELFYSQSENTTLMRFGAPLERLSEKKFQELVCVDFRHSMAVAGFVKTGGRERMIAVGRYCGAPGARAAELALTVRDDFQDRGIGAFLVDYLAWIARERGLSALVAQVSRQNPRMVAAFKGRFTAVEEEDLGLDGSRLRGVLKDWKGRGNPAAA